MMVVSTRRISVLCHGMYSVYSHTMQFNTIQHHPVQFNLSGSVLALVGPVILFIYTPRYHILPAPTARTERFAVGTCSTERSRRDNRIRSRRENHEAIDSLLAGIQPTVREICCQKLLGGTFRFGRLKRTRKRQKARR